ncbi:2-dehydropantoate 2-reductase N-terminal domain-containing protein, partial [Neobacillus niacini]|uniref:2-dehydropantoate 2-reductase N-terminal domain-containing protein n=1 Tax=Neobacillus niacini TaxID=86668 RepID=UPI002FFD5EF3
MKIGIIGAGSIGLLLSSYLSKAFSITLYTKTNAQADEINQKGILLLDGSNQNRVRIMASPISNWTGNEELTIIAVKQYQLQFIINQLDRLDCNPQNLLFLQNGMSHIKLLENIPAATIFVGSVEHGARKVNSNTVRHNGKGAINVAVFKGDTIRIKEFAHACAAINFPITLKEDFYTMLVNKLIANAV